MPINEQEETQIMINMNESEESSQFPSLSSNNQEHDIKEAACSI